MSWWTDIRDTITAPVRAGYELLTAPFDIAASVVRGDNVFDIIKAQVTEIGNPALSTLSPVTGFFGTDSGQSLLDNSTLDKLTLGYSSDFKGYAHGLNTLSSDLTISSADALSSLKFGVKTGAIIGTAGAASAYGFGAGTVLTGVGVAGNLAKGDIVGAISGAAGVAGLPEIPQEIKDAAGAAATVNNFFGPPAPSPSGSTPAPFGPAPAPYASEQAASSSGYRAPASQSGVTPSSSNTGIVVAGVALAGLYYASRKKR